MCSVGCVVLFLRIISADGNGASKYMCMHLTPLPKSRAEDRVALFHNLPVYGANWIPGYILFSYSH